MSQVDKFRAAYRQNEIPGWYRGPLHLAGTCLLSLGAIVAALLALEEVRPLEWLTVPITFLYANLVEYFGHRGPMHHRTRPFALIHRRHTLQHHRFFRGDAMYFDDSRDFKMVLFPLILVTFYLGLFALPTALLLAVFLSKNVALLFMAVAVAYFLNYELLHFAYHARPDSAIARLPLVRRLRRLHHAHHRPELMTRYNFNITYPIGDWLFGTLYRGDESALPAGKARATPTA